MSTSRRRCGWAEFPKTTPVAGEANFLLGMSEFYRGNYDKAYAAFNFLATRLPLTEVYNNLGVVEARRGRRAAAMEYFTKAVKADPSDPDYRFNLAVALYKNGDNAGAASNCGKSCSVVRVTARRRSCWRRSIAACTRPPARRLRRAAAGLPPPPTRAHVPLERIKRNYDEASYRQLEVEIHNLTEERLAKTDRKTHSAYHRSRQGPAGAEQRSRPKPSFAKPYR